MYRHDFACTSKMNACSFVLSCVRECIHLYEDVYIHTQENNLKVSSWATEFMNKPWNISLDESILTKDAFIDFFTLSLWMSIYIFMHLFIYR